MIKEVCVCGHLEERHKNLFFGQMKMYCLECWEKSPTFSKAYAGIHTFKLDNLKLIEDLAKERNLI